MPTFVPKIPSVKVPQMALKYFTFVWKIENFSYYWQKTNRVEILSPEFCINDTTGTSKWRLLFSDRWRGSNDKPIMKNHKNLILYLQKIDGNGKDSIRMTIFLSFVKDDKSPNYCMAGERNISAFSEIFVKGLMRILNCDKLFSNGALIVRCKIMKSQNTLTLVEEQCFAQTLLAVDQMNFVAVIEEFSDLIPGLKRIVRIKSASIDKTIFSMNICLLDDGTLHISFLVMANYINLYFCKMLVLHNSGNCEECGKDSEWRKNGEVSEFNLTFDFKKLMDKQNYLQNGAVTLKCEVTYTTEEEPQRIETIKYGLDYSEALQQRSNQLVQNTPASEVKKESFQSLSTLSEDLVSLYKDGTLCDTKLRTEIETFPAHKTVLSARSPVFKKIFTTDMRKNTIDYVDIQDLNDDTLRKLLEFIYTDAVDIMDWQNAKELYLAAHKYQIVSLKLKCSRFLKLNIRPSNCCDLLLLSDMHQDLDLKQFVQDYIITRDQDVFGSDEWRNFLANHVQLAADTMCLKYARK